MIPTGEAASDIRYWKSSSLFLWMLGYEFTGMYSALSLYFCKNSVVSTCTVCRHFTCLYDDWDACPGWSEEDNNPGAIERNLY